MKEINWTDFKVKFLEYLQYLPKIEYVLAFFTISVILLYIEFLIIRVLLINNKNIHLKNHIALFTASVLSIIIVNTFTTYNILFSNYIAKNNLQSISIFFTLTLVFLSVLIYKYFFIRLKTKNNNLVGFHEGPITRRKYENEIIQKFKKLRYLYLLAFIPFVMLTIKPNEKILYSMVFDNSTSMDNQITFAKNIVAKLSGRIKENSSFMVSYIPICLNDLECGKLQNESKMDLKSIINKNNKDSLIGNVFTANTFTDLKSLNFIETSDAGSPIYELIWQNFIEVKEFIKTQNFSKKKLLIMTDGEDNLYRGDFNFKAPKNSIFNYNLEGITMNEFYNEILIINYQNTLIQPNKIGTTCSEVKTIDGNNIKSFEDAFLEGLNESYLDIYLLLIICTIISLGGLIIIILK